MLIFPPMYNSQQIVDETEIGYLVCSRHTEILEKLEIFNKYLGQGHGKLMMKKFVEEVKYEMNMILLSPADKKLFSYYSKLGFNRCIQKSKQHLMHLKYGFQVKPHSVSNAICVII